jgi:hypothetical protein
VTSDDRRNVHRLDECRQDVVVAAQEERDAHNALLEGRGPMNADWSPEETASYRLRLDRWRRSSHALVGALDRLEHAQRELSARHAPHQEASPAS